MAMLLLLGCSELKVGGVAVEDAPTIDTATVDTGTSRSSPTEDSGWTGYGLFPAGSTVLSAPAEGTACNAYGTEAELLATAVGDGTVRFDHHGAVDGCGPSADTPVLVGLDLDTRIATLVWWTGDCDAIYCTDYVATVRGFPSGIWHVEERRAGRVDVIVP